MNTRHFAYESMGTHWEITIWDVLSDAQFKTIRADILTASKVFDHTFSRFIPTSFISELAQKTGVITVPEDLVAMLRIYDALYIPSGKKLNPLIGNTLEDLGYDATYSLKSKEVVRHAPDFSEALRIIDNNTIELTEPVLIDIGALGKGYFVDKIFEKLEEAGCKHMLVNGSGDIRYAGPTPIRLGLEDPEDPVKVVGVLELSSGAFAASGINRRTWGSAHHIIDPDSTKSHTELLASWVQADTAVYADALATSLLLSAPEPFREHFPFAFCVMNRERKIKRSANFSAELF